MSSHLEAGDLSGDGLAEFDHGVRVVPDRHHVIVPNGREALVVQQLLSDFAQAVFYLQMLTHICVGSHQDDWREWGYSL